MNKIDKSIELHPNKLINSALNWDFNNFLRIYEYDFKIRGLLKAISILGTFIFWFSASFLLFTIGLVFNVVECEKLGISMFLGILIPGSAIFLIKISINRNRPYFDDRFDKFHDKKIENRDPKIVKKPNLSFPSGHLFYFVMEMVIISETLSLFVLIPFAIILPLMFISRIHLGVHFPTDTIAGIILGILGSILIIAIFPDIWIMYLEITKQIII